MSDRNIRQAADLLPKAIGRDKVLAAVRALRVARRWKECVGPQLYEKCRPDRYDDGTLWIAVTGASWSQELRMRKREIIERLNEMAGERLFADLRFGVRPFPQAEELAQQELQPFEAEPVDVQIKVDEIGRAALSALGKLKAAARRPEGEDESGGMGP